MKPPESRSPEPMTSTADTASAPALFVEKAPLERYVAPEKPSLLGMSRAELADVLGEFGVPPAQRKMRVQQLWHWIYFRGATSFDTMTTISKELRAALPERFTLGAAGSDRRAGLGRRHAQMADAAAGRCRQQAAARRRMRLHPRYRTRHALRFQSGRLHADLHLLSHRHPASGAQSHRRRNRRPGDGGARSAGRLAGRHAPDRRRNPDRRSLHHQYRHDGHGRAAV